MKVEVEIPDGGICNECPLLGSDDICNWLKKQVEWRDFVFFKHPDCPSLKEDNENKD